MRNIFKTLLILISIYLCINTVSCGYSPIPNPSFETLTDWSIINLVRQSSVVYDGDYAYKSPDDLNNNECNVNVDLTGVNTIKVHTRLDHVATGSSLLVWIRIRDSPTGTTRKTIYLASGSSLSGYTHPWTERTVDVSDLSGVKTIQIFSYSNGGKFKFYVDNFVTDQDRLDNYLYLEGSNLDQYSYINVSGYENFDFYYSEILDYQMESYNPDYTYFINCTSSNTSNSYDYYKLVTDSTSLDDSIYSRISNNKVNIKYPDTNTVYTFTLWEVQDKPDLPWYFFFYQPVTYLMNYLDDSVVITELDSISVTLGRVTTGETETPETELLPPTQNEVNNTIPDVEDLPDFPDFPDENSGNEIIDENDTSTGSLNTTGLNAYYNTVNNTVLSFTSPLNSTINIVGYPLVKMTSLINGVNNGLQTSLPDLTFFTTIIRSFFEGLPTKLKVFFNFTILMRVVLMLLNR